MLWQRQDFFAPQDILEQILQVFLSSCFLCISMYRHHLTDFTYENESSKWESQCCSNTDSGK